MAASDRQYQKFKEFALGTLPAPLLGAVLPGDLAFKSVVVATSAAARNRCGISEPDPQVRGPLVGG